MSWDSSLLGLVRSTLIGTASVKVLLRARMFEGELANVGKPEFPILTFKIIDSTELQHVDTYRGVIRFWAWSKKSVSEARKVIDTIRKPLNRENLRDSKIRVVLSTTGEATRMYDKDDRLWLLTTTYSFRAIVVEKTIS